ncbi:hypothetical protein JH06_3332 [Blastocystis sp. subtype 4]|uniref:hypothetical protein n=1 Tax=Blastocystis sp. subtype 4 TaxID=944170 RepID=UPI0007120D6B|nr:hypothetical protein JH06_3332 [Blastocystis sp. subtype 4]KNB43131.1 hypothetical protein JH06_3332 [Blastocystis sp. subtype 4]|eukprot:XP_014526574.1 hypothetical protein JH06_3332 [Blastocystis sp. subtype 4]
MAKKANIEATNRFESVTHQLTEDNEAKLATVLQLTERAETAEQKGLELESELGKARMMIQTLEGEKETLQANETQLRLIINQSVERRSQDNILHERILALEHERNESLTDLAKTKASLIEKADEIKSLQNQLNDARSQLQEKIAYMNHNNLSLQSQSSQLEALESQMSQLQINLKLQQQMIQAKDDEIVLKRRNETRLLDLNSSLQSKNTDLEKQIESLRYSFATDWVGMDVTNVEVLLHVVVENQDMCYCRLTYPTVGSFRYESTCKWLQLDVLRQSFPSAIIPTEIHSVLHSELHSTLQDLNVTQKELESLQSEYENYRKRTRIATVKLQQALASSQQSDTLKEFQQKVNELELKEQQLRSETQEKDIALSSLRGQLQKREEVIQELEESIHHLESSISEMETKTSTLEKEKKELESVIQEVKGRLYKLEKQTEAASSVTEERVSVQIGTDVEETVSGVNTSPEQCLELSESSEVSKQPIESENQLQTGEQAPVEEPVDSPSMEPTNSLSAEPVRIDSQIATNSLLRVLQDATEESVGLLELPHKQLEAMREEVVSLRARLADAEKNLSLLQYENTKKDKHLEQLEGDLKAMNEVQNMENLQYMRHTLVRFLCYSSASEQQMILPAVGQLLKLTPEEMEMLSKHVSVSRFRGWFS